MGARYARGRAFASLAAAARFARMKKQTSESQRGVPRFEVCPGGVAAALSASASERTQGDGRISLALKSMITNPFADTPNSFSTTPWAASLADGNAARSGP